MFAHLLQHEVIGLPGQTADKQPARVRRVPAAAPPAPAAATAAAATAAAAARLGAGGDWLGGDDLHLNLELGLAEAADNQQRRGWQERRLVLLFLIIVVVEIVKVVEVVVQPQLQVVVRCRQRPSQPGWGVGRGGQGTHSCRRRCRRRRR